MTDVDARRRALAGGLLGAAALAACSAQPAASLSGDPTPAPTQTPTATPGAGFRLVFGSCADQNRPQPVWRAVAAEQADLLLFGGDNVYASKAPWSLANLEAAYAAQAQVPGYASLLLRPYMAIWDDHDYGANDGGVEFAGKAESKEAFLRFFKAPANDPRRQREGLYDARIFGPPGQRVQVIVLDTRWFRSPWRATSFWNAKGRERYEPDPDGSKTVLGPTQWAWLEAQLQQPAEVRIVYSSIQVLALGHGFERWGLLPSERERLLQLLAKAKDRATVLLSGDRHIGALYEERDGLPRALLELTSSGLSHAWANASEDDTMRLGALVRVNHYGAVDIDWAAQSLTLRLNGEQGAPLLQHRLPFAR
jgi:alkaline phosphatase D